VRCAVASPSARDGNENSAQLRDESFLLLGSEHQVSITLVRGGEGAALSLGPVMQNPAARRACRSRLFAKIDPPAVRSYNLLHL
jgi:hypothetical protein